MLKAPSEFSGSAPVTHFHVGYIRKDCITVFLTTAKEHETVLKTLSHRDIVYTLCSKKLKVKEAN